MAFPTLGGSDLWDVDGFMALALHQGGGGNGHVGRPGGVVEVPRVLTSKGFQLHGIFAYGAN